MVNFKDVIKSPGMFLFSTLLSRFIQKGTLRVIDSNGKVHEFSGTPVPLATIRLHQADLPLKLFRNPELHVGEAYMEGTLTMEDCTLSDFLGLFSINRGGLASYPLQKVIRRINRLLRFLNQHNPIGKAQEHVAHHYDLSRELYERFLDEDLQYSCAYFLDPGESLETAQANKRRHIIAKLKLEPGQRVLDIGCGWGGLALEIAQRADVEVLGITLSEEQLKVAAARAKTLGLDGRVRFELLDYRHITERFDRIVSIGMFEHVGVVHYDEFFDKMFDLLTDSGFALLHSIGHMSPPGSAGPWIRKYIFPGAYAPALSEVFAACERQHLWVSDVEVLRLHYADTLVEWHKRFQENRETIAGLYDERFCRMWEFYLVCAEAIFRTGAGMVFQMQLSRTRDAVPLSRDYIFENERNDLEAERSAKTEHAPGASPPPPPFHTVDTGKAPGLA